MQSGVIVLLIRISPAVESGLLGDETRIGQAFGMVEAVKGGALEGRMTETVGGRLGITCLLH